MKKIILMIMLFICSTCSATTPKIYPDKVASNIQQLPPKLEQQWREQGYCLIDGLYSPQEVAEIRAAILQSLGSKRNPDFGGVQFPGPKAFNLAALDERLLGIAKQLLKTDRVILTQADAWAKVGTPRPSKGYQVFDNYDQRLHMDFPNHTMLHPPTWDQPEAVALIIYLDDHNKTGGMTAVRPRLGANDPAYKYPYTDMPGVVNWPYINDRTHAENYIQKYDPQTAAFRDKIYSELKAAAFNPGTVLLYRHDIWHRGTPVNNGAERVVINIVYKKPDLPWFYHWSKAFTRNLYDWEVDPTDKAPTAANFAQLIPQLSVTQRAALGFPLPGDPSITPQMLLALQARYPSMDITAYK